MALLLVSPEYLSPLDILFALFGVGVFLMVFAAGIARLFSRNIKAGQLRMLAAVMILSLLLILFGAWGLFGILGLALAALVRPQFVTG